MAFHGLSLFLMEYEEFRKKHCRRRIGVGFKPARTPEYKEN